MAPRTSKLKQRQNKELTDWQHVRLRTEMYLGSREVVNETMVNYNGHKLELQEVEYVPALLTAFRELLDNAMDEIVGHGNGKRIQVEFDPETLTMSVKDDGAGIPIKQIQMVFTRLRAGSNFDKRENVVGTNGIGASAVNYVSSHFKVEVWSNGVHYVQEYEEDNINDEELVIRRPKRSSAGATKHGTKVQFTPSSSVFKHLILPEELVKARLHELSFIYPKVQFTFNGKRINTKDFFKGHDVIEFEVNSKENNFFNTFYIIPNFHEGNEEHMHAVVNGICAYTGGSRSLFLQSNQQYVVSILHLTKHHR